MATTRFNNLILKLSRLVKEARTDPSTAGDTAKQRFKSALLVDYVNRAMKVFVQEMLQALGPNKFSETFPEMVKTSTTLTLSGGSVTLPTDAWIVTDLDKSDYSLRFFSLRQEEVQMVRGGAHKLIVPSATKPVFWQEQDKLYTLGLTSGDVKARYIVSPQDIAIIMTASGAGTQYQTSANLTWTAATKLLTVNADIDAAATWVNKVCTFRTATNVYIGRITAAAQALAPDIATITLDGPALPAGDIGAGLILDLMIPDDLPDQTDLILDPVHDDAILSRAYQLALNDTYMRNPQ